MRFLLRFAATIAAVWLPGDATSTSAHDLPISRMMVVAAEETMHVELVLNAEELSFFSEIDRDKNGFLDSGEQKAQNDQISQRIVDCFLFQIDGRPATAAVHGVVPNIGSHHLTIRAHYPVDARVQSVHLESRLVEITRNSHVIEVTLKRPDGRYSARLDAHDQEVVFDYEKKASVAKAPATLPTSSKNEQRGDYSLLIGLAALLGSFFLFRAKHR